MAGRRIADLLIKIGADSYEFQQKSKEVEKGLEQLSQKLTSVGKTISLAVTAPLTVFGVACVKAFDTVEKSAAKVRQGIEQTGGAAKLTLEELQDYASGLQAVTLFDDDQILNDVTAKMLTFTNIAGENFKKAQKAALDMATVLDQDVKGIVTQLGKALNDPVKNMSALGRMGIQFSKDQEKVIRAFAETNRLGEAQALMLDVLASRYGGQAEAAAKAGLGAMTQMKNNWGDLMEQFGEIMMPVVQNIARALDKVVMALQKMDPGWKKFIVILGTVAVAAGPVLLALGGVVKILPTLKAGLSVIIGVIKLVTTSVKSLTVAIASNPLGLLLTLVTTGITLFAAFAGSTRDAAAANGELTNKVIDESKQVNTLIGKLTSANTSEKERKAALDELKSVQPSIVEGLNAESLELETLKKRAAEYNQQLVLRIALARKQDQVAAAIERQTEAGVKQAQKEAEIYAYLSNIGAKLQSGDFEYGRHNPNKGFFEWAKASEQVQRNLINHFNDIMASGDTMAQKAHRISQMFSPGDRFRDKIDMDGVSASKLGRMSHSVGKLQGEVDEVGEIVRQAEADVRNFAEAFSMSLTAAVEGATGAVDGLGGSAETTSTRTQKSIAELNEEIKSLEEQKQESFDPAQIAEFNAQIATLKKEIDRLNSLGTAATQARGKITELQAEIKKLEEQKNSTFDVAVIAECNEKIAQLKTEVDDLNKILPKDLIPIEFAPIITSDMKLIMPEFKIRMPDLKPYVSKAAEQMRAIHEMVRDGIFGWAGEISAELSQDMMETTQIVKTYTDALVAKGWEFSAALEMVGSKVSETIQAFDQSLANFLSQSIVAAAEAIGQIMAGDLGFGGLMKAILLQFANFLKQIGTQLIEFAIMIIAFKSALKSVLANPWAALAVGAAMVAAAALMTALINKNAQKNVPALAQGGLAFGPTYAMVGDNPNAGVDPEVIAPLSKLKDMMAGGGTANVNISLSGEMKAKGRDLVYVLGKENFKTEILGG
ncbi:hypothetical protein KML24007_03880 [Alistipes indistinctus]|uniref:phage tail length tape measure family protein n=1 Tax=Alistipes indistinctus TaxID=626932 RepID=UPI0036F21F52